jgi:AraC-like DNA-binding protein
MRYRARRPRAPLQGLVASFWDCEGPGQKHARESVLPSGTAQLIVNLRRDETLVVGPHARPFVIDTDELTAVLGVHFAADGAAPFFGVGAGSLRDRHVPLDTLWGVAAARRFREQLLTAPTAAARLALVEATMVTRLRTLPARHPAVAHALARLDGGVGVQAVVQDVGYSARRFISLFTDAVGLTPKLYQRVRRFQQLLARIRHGRRDWVALALDSGFFDQAHLIRDFREFSGLTPRAYLAAGGEWQNHVPLRE